MFHHSWSVTGFGARNLDETVVMSFFSSYGPVSVSESVADRAPPLCKHAQLANMQAYLQLTHVMPLAVQLVMRPLAPDADE